MIGGYDTDAKMATEVLAKQLNLPATPTTPTDYLWHHVEDRATKLLVPKDLHGVVRHSDGSALIRGVPDAHPVHRAQCPSDPAGC